MKKWITILIFSLGSVGAFAQMYYDIGLFLGTSYYLGDINPDRHFYTPYLKPAGGLSFRINFDPRWAWKQSIRIGQISADDADSETDFQQTRNLNFYSPVYELTSTVEFNFLRFDPWKNTDWFTPYTYAGIGFFYMNPKTELEGNTYVLKDHKTEGTDYSNIQFAIPFGVGFKIKASSRVFIELEWGMRKTFTDYMDDVSGNYPDDPTELDPVTIDLSDRSLDQQGPDGTNWGTQRGTSSKKDWYFFSGISLVINLNNDPNRCYFDQNK